VRDIADGPQYRLHKGTRCRSKAASGFNPSRGPGRGLHRGAHIMAGRHDGQCSRWWPSAAAREPSPLVGEGGAKRRM